MPHPTRPSCGPTQRFRRREGRSRSSFRNTLAALFCLVTLGGLPHPDDAPADPGARQAQATSAAPGRYARLFNPEPLSGAGANEGWRGAPLGSSFRMASAAPVVPAVTLAAVEPHPKPTLPSQPAPDTSRVAQRVPLPVARPSALLPAPGPRMAVRQVARRTQAPVRPEATAEPPSFFEALFSGRREAGPALAYAALESDTLDTRRAGRLVPTPAPEGEAAVYDISAHVVRLPSGEVLEAHSGLGDRQDDPTGVHVRMRGSTPPGTYDLTEREQLFHGVRALRLNPVGGSAAIHGRDGLLAHTYMLGPSGASNGCVSFRDYNRFLQAYLRGEVRRLVVVSGRRLDGPPRLANRRIGMPRWSAAQPGDG